MVYTLLSGPMVYTLFPYFPRKMVYTIAFFALWPRGRATDRGKRGATVFSFSPGLGGFRAPQKGTESRCHAQLVESVENCFWHFLMIFDVFCPARKLLKIFEISLDTF